VGRSDDEGSKSTPPIDLLAMERKALYKVTKELQTINDVLKSPRRKTMIK
jgi:hypothetical protein